MTHRRVTITRVVVVTILATLSVRAEVTATRTSIVTRSVTSREHPLSRHEIVRDTHAVLYGIINGGGGCTVALAVLLI
jgi:hypothetical protein